MPHHVETLIAGWDRIDEAAQVIGAVSHHARYAVRQLDAACEIVHGAGGERHSARPSTRWGALLDELQEALGRATKFDDEDARDSESDWAMRAVAAFLTTEALALVYSDGQYSEATVSTLETLTEPALVTAKRLQAFADDTPATSGSDRSADLDALEIRPRQDTDHRRWEWAPLIGASVFLLVSLVALVPLELYTASYVLAFIVVPILCVSTLYFVDRIQELRAPSRCLDRERKVDEIVRCGRIIDRQASYLRFMQANVRDVEQLAAAWQEACDAPGANCTRASLDLVNIRGSLGHGYAIADALATSLTNVTTEIDKFVHSCQGRARTDREVLVASTGHAGDLLDRSIENSERTAELALNLPLHLSPEPVGVDSAALAEHLRQVVVSLKVSVRQGRQALKRIKRIVETL